MLLLTYVTANAVYTLRYPDNLEKVGNTRITGNVVMPVMLKVMNIWLTISPL